MADQIRARINVVGAMDLIKMSKNPLTPIFEAMTNSLEALAQRFIEYSENYRIDVKMFYARQFDEGKNFEFVEIVDTGIGFTQENFERFREFFDKSKGYDNRGTGRLQYLHRFDEVEVSSVFYENGELKRRSFSCGKKSFIQNSRIEQVSNEVIETSVKLKRYIGSTQEKEYFDTLSLDQLCDAIKSHFLLRFYLDGQKENLKAPTVNVSLYEGGEMIGSESISPDKMPTPDKQGQISVPYMKVLDFDSKEIDFTPVPKKSEVIKWAHFAIPESELLKNGMFLCSKDIPVAPLNFSYIKKNDQINGNRFLTAFYGDVLDDPKNVSDSVDQFTFPSIKEVAKSSDDIFFDKNGEYLFIDIIEAEVAKVLPKIYEEVVNIKEKLSKDVVEIANSHGISNEIAMEVSLSPNDDEKSITSKLYKCQAATLAAKSYKARRVFESLEKLDPTAKDYQESVQEKIEEFSSLVDAQNKEELSRYIIRREMVASVLAKIIDKGLTVQNEQKKPGKNRDREGLLHDLIFKRKSASTKSLNDLWILNEEFMHFDGCSELQLDQIELRDGNKLLLDISKKIIDELGIKTKRRPDIFLYAGAGQCLIVELKEPDEDLSNHLNQITKYCNLLANFATIKIDKFHCYLIGENIIEADLPNDFENTVGGGWVKPSEPVRKLGDGGRISIATSQIEIIKLSSIAERAHLRNMSFASKLGLHELLKSEK